MAFDDEENYVDESEEALGKVARWVPYTVVFTALAGFMLLAWYAYQAGTKSVNENELLVVEADDAPVKEKPDDPGGMQFPNQNKMIFETFSGKESEPPKVERLMPAPEEPVVVSGNTDPDQGTTTWVNDKLQTKTPSTPETASKQDKENFVKEAAVEKEGPAKSGEINSFRKGSDSPAAGTPVVEKTAEKPAEPAPAAESVKAPEKKAEAAPTPKKGKAQLQLGAYRSEKEAETNWAKISKAHSRTLKGYGHNVVRADLGAKGIYYRLRVTGVASMDAARGLCKDLSAKGQACMPIAG